MLGFGLDAYVCVGTKAKGTPHCWVLTRGTDGTITFWESLTAHRFIFQHANSTHRKAPIPGDRTRNPLAARPPGWPLRCRVLRDKSLLRISALKMELNRFDVTETLRFRSSCRSQKALRKSFELCCAVCICQRKSSDSLRKHFRAPSQRTFDYTLVVYPFLGFCPSLSCPQHTDLITEIDVIFVTETGSLCAAFRSWIMSLFCLF